MVGQKALPAAARAKAEMGGDGGGDILEGDKAAAARACALHENGDAFAGMVRAAPGGVVAVIGGEDHEVSFAQAGQEPADLAIEPFERACIARHIAAVAVFGVEL